MTKYSIVIAGSTEHTKICAERLLQDHRFTISGVVTPAPRPVGRKQKILPNPLNQFANDNQIPVVLVEKRIDTVVQHKLETTRPDFLLVVDFGYIVPNWMLELPKVAPINIHPSTLPRWRGSSPGQFVLLYGEKESSVSVIVMNDRLDQGDLVTQIPFAVDQTWTQAEYYQAGFQLVAVKLPDILTQLAQGEITPLPQPLESPTPVAGRFTKEDGFVPWEVVSAAISEAELTDKTSTVELNSETKTAFSDPQMDRLDDSLENTPLPPILTAAYTHHKSLAKLLFHASKALAPWPGLWTIVPTAKDKKRMKILSTSLENSKSLPSDQNKLILEKVQIEGKKPTTWQEVKNTLTV